MPVYPHMIISEASLHMAGVNLKLPIEFSGLQMYVVYLCIERTQLLGLYLFCFSHSIIEGYDAYCVAWVCMLETIKSMAALNL